MKVRDAIKLLKRHGWVLKDTRGSHRQFVNAIKSGKVTLAGHPSDEIPPGT